LKLLSIIQRIRGARVKWPEDGYVETPDSNVTRFKSKVWCTIASFTPKIKARQKELYDSRIMDLRFRLSKALKRDWDDNGRLKEFNGLLQVLNREMPSVSHKTDAESGAHSSQLVPRGWKKKLDDIEHAAEQATAEIGATDWTAKLWGNRSFPL
jgi:hypothetical protein